MVKWTKQELTYLTKWFPLLGSGLVAKDLNRSARSVSKQAAYLKIRQAQPKEKRLCTTCRENNQLPEGFNSTSSRSTQCNSCFSKKTKTLRSARGPQPVESYLQDLITTRRNHLKTKQSYLKVTITIHDLLEIYNKQNGLCYYSGIKMETKTYGQKRSPYRMSLDQRIPKAGYTKENIVLCCWQANAAKDEFSEEQLYEFCENIVKHRKKKI